MKTYRFFTAAPLVAVLLAAFAIPGMAQEVLTGKSAAADVPALVLSWEAPTTREDGSELTAVDLAHYHLVCKHQGTGKSVHHRIPADVGQPYVVKKSSFLPDPGTYQCHMTVTDTDGGKSGPSNDIAMAWSRAVPSSFIIIVN